MAPVRALLALCAMMLPACGGASTPSTTPTRGNFAGLVEIGNGRKLFLECRGTGTPTVVLISGFRGASDDWTHVVAAPGDEPRPSPLSVLPQVARFSRVCAYDRPGTVSFDGRSTESTAVLQPTTAQADAADLHALMNAAGLPAPYVLVPHSWGGLITYLYASKYPGDVAGLVLVDPGSEFLQTALTPEQWDRFVRAAIQLSDPVTLEAVDYERSVEAIHNAPAVPRVPAVVLTADHPFDFGAGGSETWPAWLEAQDRLAALLDAAHVTDTNSGHYIAGEQPALVVGRVRDVVQAVRGQTPAAR
jgi:pimeloyl-ACP methyl ester carboxylesterase